MLTRALWGVEDEGTALSCSNQRSEETDTQEAQTNAVLGAAQGLGTMGDGRVGTHPVTQLQAFLCLMNT